MSKFIPRPSFGFFASLHELAEILERAEPDCRRRNIVEFLEQCPPTNGAEQAVHFLLCAVHLWFKDAPPIHPDLCPRCGHHEQATHHWLCQERDGTPTGLSDEQVRHFIGREKASQAPLLDEDPIPL